jgi:hypothetical protein
MRGGLLGLDMARYAQMAGAGRQQAPQAPPQQPQRPEQPRVSGWRVFDRVLGGRTVTDALDMERERSRAEALRPQMEERDARIRAAVSAMGPQAEIAYALDPEGFGSQVAEQFGTDVLASGSILARDGAAVVGAPVIERFDDRFGSMDPLNPGAGAQFSAPRGPTRDEINVAFSNDTARFEAENPVLGAGATWVGADGAPRARGYIAPVNVADATDLIDPLTGQPIYQNQRDAPMVSGLSDADQAAVARAEDTIARLEGSIGRATSFVDLIERGELNLGPIENLVSQGRNLAGQSDPNSRNYVALRQWAEEARNAILQSATGPQTEGDALRALNTILSGTTDARVVQQALRQYTASYGPLIDVNRRDIERRTTQGGQSGAAQGDSAPDRAALLAEARRRGLIQ